MSYIWAALVGAALALLAWFGITRRQGVSSRLARRHSAEVARDVDRDRAEALEAARRSIAADRAEAARGVDDEAGAGLAATLDRYNRGD